MSNFGRIFLGALLVMGMGTACGSDDDTSARDACEAQAGAGNCVERDDKWVPVGSIDGTTSTTAASTTTTTARDKSKVYSLQTLCQAKFKVDQCVYDKNRDEWVPAAGAGSR